MIPFTKSVVYCSVTVVDARTEVFSVEKALEHLYPFGPPMRVDIFRFPAGLL